MKSLATLIKLYRKRLDDKRLELVREEELLEELHKILERIREEMRNEKAIAENSVPASYYFPAYIEQAVNTERRIESLIDEQRKKIEAIQEEIAEEFSELKKYEILREIKQKAEVKEEERIEQMQLDEIATNSFLQSGKEN